MSNQMEMDLKEGNACAVCKAVAPHVCSGCKEVAYCSKEHQKEHWKEHKSICKPFEVKSNDELGRHLIASRNLSFNDKITTELPLVIGPRLFEPAPICLGCYQPPTPGLRCPRCLWPVCQPQCPGLQDPHHHAIECIILSLGKPLALQPFVPRYEIITPLRCLLLQKRNHKKWLQIISMEDHSASRGPNTEAYRELEEVVDCLIENYLNKVGSGLKYSKELLHKICDVLDVNALEITCTGNIQLLGLYPTVCIMEHNCVPNTMHYFTMPEFKITLQPNTNITKGDHLSTSYTYVLWGTHERREYLKQNKYFLCRCQRCSDPTELGTYLSALRCHGLEQNNVCGGWQLPVSPLDENSEWKCDKCPVTLTSGEVKNLISILTAESDNLIKQFKPSVGQVTELLQKLLFFLHPHHYLCYETKHLLIQLYGHQSGYLHGELSVDQLKSKEEICRDLLIINKILDPGYRRLSLYSSVLMYELHSALLELVDRKIIPYTGAEEAKKLLVEVATFLEYELPNTSGANMRTLAKSALFELESKQKVSNEVK